MWDLRALRSPFMRAKKPRSVAVHEMRGFLRAIRRDHPHHVHTLWYVFSLTFCSVSLLFFYIYKNARTIGATPLGDEHIRENIAVFFMNSSTEVREEVYILAAIGSLLIVPQLLSYFVNGLFGCGSPPIFVSAVARAE